MDDQFLIDRIDILSGDVSDDFHTANGPLSRKDAVNRLQDYLDEKIENDFEISTAEADAISVILQKNSEWTDDEKGESEYTLWDVFYKKRAEFLSYQDDKYFVAINPIFNYQQMLEGGNGSQFLFQNRKGIDVRARIGERVAFYSSVTDNQERGPQYYQNYIRDRKSIPAGGTYYKSFKNSKPGSAQDYILASGYVDVEAVKDAINLSFGYDRIHLGDGYRSLFLSDWGSNYTYFGINTKLWKFNLQNLYMELTPQFQRGADRLLPKKYAVAHHLSFNAAKWLNIGFFEAVTFSRPNHFEFQYLNPVIFYRAIEQTVGSPDNALLGLNFKLNPGVGAVIYGQLILDEFNFGRITSGDKWWANKYGLQAGIKMADLGGVENLLVQLEGNLVRPFTYSYDDSIADYTHYNQALAHPLGANFSELILNVHYKPIENLFLNLTTIYYKQGIDLTDSIAYGGDIFKSNALRNDNFGIEMYNGLSQNVLFANLNAAYEIKPNVFFDLGGGYRSQNNALLRGSAPFFYGGFRWNTSRRQYNF